MRHYFETADCANYELLRENARHNRNNPTDAECFLWNYLRGGVCGNKFRRQHIIDNFIVDFVCLSKKLVIEVDGKYHDTPEQVEDDIHRTEILKEYGYKVIRFTNEDVLESIDNVMLNIRTELY